MASRATTNGNKLIGRQGDGLLIGLSISDTPASELARLGMGRIHLDRAFIEVSRHLLALGCSLAYGGDHRITGFTDVLFDLVRTYDDARKPPVERIRNYLARPIFERFSVSDRAKLKDVVTLIDTGLPADLDESSFAQDASQAKHLNPDLPADRLMWARLLTTMRQRMNADIDARILLGGRYGGIVDGKLDRFIGKYPGLLEEAHLAIGTGKPIYLLGGFGGCTRLIVDALRGNSHDELSLEFHTAADPVYREMIENFDFSPDPPVSYECIVQDLKDAGIDGLNNSLSREENKILFESDDVELLVAVLTKGIRSLTSD